MKSAQNSSPTRLTEDALVLEVLATHPSYQGRDLGSMLLKAGCEGANGEGMKIYLEGTSKVLPLFERFGFVEQA